MSTLIASEKANISSNFWNSIERGRQVPSSVVLSKIADALQVPACRILGTNHCPYVNDNFLVEIETLFAERKNEKQRALKILSAVFLE